MGVGMWGGCQGEDGWQTWKLGDFGGNNISKLLCNNHIFAEKKCSTQLSITSK